MAYPNQGIIAAANCYFSAPGTASMNLAASAAGAAPSRFWRAKFRMPSTFAGVIANQVIFGLYGASSTSISVAISSVTRIPRLQITTTTEGFGPFFANHPLTMGAVYDIVLQFTPEPNPWSVYGHLDCYIIENGSGAGGVQAHIRSNWTGTIGAIAMSTSGTMVIAGSASNTVFAGTIYEVTDAPTLLTVAQMAQLGQGLDVITDMGLTANTHFKPTSAGAITWTDYSGNGNVMTEVGSGTMTAGVAPTYGASAVSVDDITPVFAAPGSGSGLTKYFNQTGSKSITVQGSYVGTAPANIDGQWVQYSVILQVSTAASSGATTLLLQNTTGLITGASIPAQGGIPAGTFVGAVVYNTSVALVNSSGAAVALTAAIAINTYVQFGDPTIVLTPWATMTNLVTSSGRYTATSPPLACGGRALLQVRLTASPSIQGTMQRHTACGLVWVLGAPGQSNEFRAINGVTGVLPTGNNVSMILYNIWGLVQGGGPVSMANLWSALYPSIDLLFVETAVSSSGMLAGSGHGIWYDFTTVATNTNMANASMLLIAINTINYAGGDFNIVIANQGENDMGQANSTAALPWLTMYRAVSKYLLNAIGRTRENCLDLVAIVGPNAGTPSAALSTDLQAAYLRLANERAGQDRMPAGICEDHCNFILNTQNVHCSIAHYVPMHIGKFHTAMSFLRRDRPRGIGPHVIKTKLTGNVVQVWVQHENGRNLVVRNPNQPLSGWTFKDNSGSATIASYAVARNYIRFVLSRPLGAGASGGYLQGHAMTTPIPIGMTTFSGHFGTGTSTTTLTIDTAQTGIGVAVGQTLVNPVTQASYGTIVSGSGSSWVCSVTQNIAASTPMFTSDPSQIVATSGSTQITINGLPTGHGLQAGHLVALDCANMTAFAGFPVATDSGFTGATALGLSIEYTIVSAGTNSVVVTAFQAATSTANGGGILATLRPTNWLVDDSTLVGEALPLRPLFTVPLSGKPLSVAAIAA